MDGYMKFELSDVGLTVFNKEPIRLEHNITHIPPVGQGGGTRAGARVELYRVDDPDGPPVAVLLQVKTHIGSWLTELSPLTHTAEHVHTNGVSVVS
jgi:hypothetical protein